MPEISFPDYLFFPLWAEQHQIRIRQEIMRARAASAWITGFNGHQTTITTAEFLDNALWFWENDPDLIEDRHN